MSGGRQTADKGAADTISLHRYSLADPRDKPEDDGVGGVNAINVIMV
jgi:hypothetical protein